MAESVTAQSQTGRKSCRARIERIFDHNADTRSLFVSIGEDHNLKWAPGQFISISIPLGDETRTRAYTIASNPEQSHLLEICFNRVPGGRGAAWLFERAVGDALEFSGPFGTFTMDSPPAKETVFIAEGTAIAPIRAMLRRAQSGAHAPMFLLYAASAPDRILYRGEFEELAARDPDFVFETIVAAGDWVDLYGLLRAETERRWIEADTNRAREFYIAGIGRGVAGLRDLLRGSGYERRAVRYEQW